MKKTLLLLLASLLAAPTLFGQDCSTLTFNVTGKSNYNGFNISCSGSSDGVITVEASGGTQPYTFIIDQLPANASGSFSGVFTDVPSGNYTATVRDGNNCEKQVSVTLTTPTVLTATLAVTSNFNGQDLSCSGSNDGIITVTAAGGVTPYTYSLVELPGNTSGNVTGIFTSLPAGTYSAKITDSNGCHVTTISVAIDAPPTLAVTSFITSSYNGQMVTCNGASDAEITITAAGGTGPYLYKVNEIPGNISGITTGVFTGIGAGVYTFMVRDVNACAAVTNQLIVVEPMALAASTAVTSNYNGYAITCFGSSDGQLTTVATGGTGQYTYVLNEQPGNTTGAATGTFFNLPGGNYTVNIRDANACSFNTTPLSITQPSTIAIGTTISEGLPENCSDAQINAVASGGVAPYLYQLDETQNNTGVFTGLTNGSYTVLVRDMNNCQRQTFPILISQASTITASASVSSNYNGVPISCFGDSDGSITITSSGGTGFSYESIEFPGNTTGAVTGTFTGLGAGSYTFLVRDQDGCEKITLPVIIVSPQVLTVDGAISSDYQGENLSCFNAADGEITLTANGGTGTYSYTLVDLSSNTTGTTSGMFTGLAAGTYILSVSDANACEAFTSAITLTAPDEITVAGEVTPDQTGDDGAVLLTVTGGTAPYSFLWSNESTQQNLINVASGEYDVEVLDVNACSVTESFIIPLVVGIEHERDGQNILIGYDRQLQEFYLSYALVSPANVSIKIFDATGKSSAALYARQYAGEYKQGLSKQILQHGLYIAHIKIDEKLYIRKFNIR